MSAKSVVFSGTTALAINVNYLFAYAVEPPGNPTDWTRVVAHQYGSFDFAPWGDPGGPLTPWDDTGGDHAGALLRRWFSSVRVVAVYRNGRGVSDDEEGAVICIASGLRSSWAAAWPSFRDYS